MEGNEGTDGTESAGKGGRSEGTDGKSFHIEAVSLEVELRLFSSNKEMRRTLLNIVIDLK